MDEMELLALKSERLQSGGQQDENGVLMCPVQ